MGVKVYGVSDDLCEIEGAPYPADEIGCFESDCIIELTDNTVLRVSYGYGDGIWKVEGLKQGFTPYELEKCLQDDGEHYSDVFTSTADYKQHCLVPHGKEVDAAKIFPENSCF